MKIQLHSILDWLYPPTCIACGKLIPLNHKQPRDILLCELCQTLFEPISAPVCNTCGIPTENPVDRCVSCYGKTFWFTNNRAAFLYDELMRDLLHELKFRQNKQIAHSLGKLWAVHMSNYQFDDNTFLVPLPLHPKKQRERGFNQAEILTRHLSSRLNIPTEYALIRIIDTPPQSGLHPRQRVENVTGAFQIAKDISVPGKNYIIIDDIYTTGASLNECARVLKDAGAANITCMTLSIVEKKKD
ncbi:MAG: ComF family protein [Firmicutes bacterium]|nr:ComF family protein [Bacillota bacterium]